MYSNCWNRFQDSRSFRFQRHRSQKTKKGHRLIQRRTEAPESILNKNGFVIVTKFTTFCITNPLRLVKKFLPGSWSTASEASTSTEEEYFDLLALLEPNKYVKDDPKDLTALREEFNTFSRQKKSDSSNSKRRLAKFQNGNDKLAPK